MKKTILSLIFLIGFVIGPVNAFAQASSGYVTVAWNTGIETVTNTNPDNPAQGVWFIQFASQGLITRSSPEIFLTIDQTVGGAPKKVCSFGPEYGTSFAVQYPSCATGNQNLPQATIDGGQVFEAGKQYHVFFTDYAGTVLSDVHLLQEIPASVPTSTGETGNPDATGTDPGAETSGNTGSTTGSTTTGSNSGAPLFNSTQEGLLSGGLVPDCGYNIKTISNSSGTGRMCGLADIITLIQNIIEYIFILVLPIAAIVFAYVGYLYLTSGGNTAKHTQAKQAMTNLGIGILIILAAWLIIKSVLTTLGVDTGISNMFLDLTT
jgi:hypothetical protein